MGMETLAEEVLACLVCPAPSPEVCYTGDSVGLTSGKRMDFIMCLRRIIILTKRKQLVLILFYC